MTTIRARVMTAAALSAVLVAGAAGVPQTVAQTTQQTAPDAGSGQFTDEQLRSFAAASIEVESLHQRWAPQIAAAETPDAQADIRAQAMEEMGQAVQAEGLTVDEYNEIVSAIRADPETAQTVVQYRSELK